MSQSIGTLKEALIADSSHLNSLHLLALVLSAQKRVSDSFNFLVERSLSLILREVIEIIIDLVNNFDFNFRFL